MPGLRRPRLISQVLPSPVSICEKGANPWPDEGTTITVALATFNCFAAVKTALFLFSFSLGVQAQIRSIPFRPKAANPSTRTTIMWFYLGPHFSRAVLELTVVAWYLNNCSYGVKPTQHDIKAVFTIWLLS